jgi:hypothetical protein
MHIHTVVIIYNLNINFIKNIEKIKFNLNNQTNLLYTSKTSLSSV